MTVNEQTNLISHEKKEEPLSRVSLDTIEGGELKREEEWELKKYNNKTFSSPDDLFEKISRLKIVNGKHPQSAIFVGFNESGIWQEPAEGVSDLIIYRITKLYKGTELNFETWKKENLDILDENKKKDLFEASVKTLQEDWKNVFSKELKDDSRDFKLLQSSQVQVDGLFGPQSLKILTCLEKKSLETPENASSGKASHLVPNNDKNEENLVHEVHPEIGSYTRFKIGLFQRSPEEERTYLEKLGFEVKKREGTENEFIVRKAGDDGPFCLLNQEGFELGDIADYSGYAVNTAGYYATRSGLLKLAPKLARKHPIGAFLVASLGALLAEESLQGVGKITGQRDEFASYDETSQQVVNSLAVPTSLSLANSIVKNTYGLAKGTFNVGKNAFSWAKSKIFSVANATVEGAQNIH